MSIIRTLTCLLVVALGATSLPAQPAPAPYRSVPHVQEAVSDLIRAGGPEAGPNFFFMEEVDPSAPQTGPYVKIENIDHDGAAWLQVRFRELNLGSNSTLTIKSRRDEEVQVLRGDVVEGWSRASVMFNGNAVELLLNVAPGESGVFYEIEEIVVGEQVRSIGPDDESLYGSPESLCGFEDDRVSSEHKLVGRIMPVGCTGWLIADDVALTAGHCVTTGMQLLQFNAPASLADGTPVMPFVKDQYFIDQDSIQADALGVGHDWAVFRVRPNTETGLLPGKAQGGAFQISRTLMPEQVEVNGYGLDNRPAGSSPPHFRNSSSQTHQKNRGSLLGMLSSSTGVKWLGHQVDTEAGNSGGPIIALDENGLLTDTAVGIHTHAGCDPHLLQGNKGTPFTNEALWQAIESALGHD